MGIISNDLQAKAQNAADEIKAAAARWQAKKAKRLAKKRNRATNSQHKAAMARRAESAADSTRFHNSHTDDLMSAAIVERM